MITYNELKNNIEKVMENVERICAANNVNSNSVTVIGASKTMNNEVLDMLDDISIIKLIGENRVQELLEKYRNLKNIKWHFIGQLQTNKVKYIADKVELIHSVDRLNLAETIDKEAKKSGIISNILIEINMGDEAAKGGIAKDNILKFIEELSAFENIRIQGLMSVMPQCDEETLRGYYRTLNGEFNKALKLKGRNLDIRYLSAGMSKDYQIALEYGANMLRLGTAIFGERAIGGINEKKI